MRHRYRLIGSGFLEVLETWVNPDHLPGMTGVLPGKPAVSQLQSRTCPPNSAAMSRFFTSNPSGSLIDLMVKLLIFPVIFIH
jgi:hypothetical protein